MKMHKLLASVAALTFAAVLSLQAADAAKKAKPYPLDTCVVSGEKLGGMGEAYSLVQDGQEVKLCCKGCLKAFNKDTAKYMAKIKEAADKKAK